MSTIEKLDAEITALQGEAARVEAMPPTVAERYAKVEAEYVEAERVYRDRGLNPSAAHPGEMAHLQRLAVIGCCMVVGADKLLKAEHQRIAAMGEGLSVVDKASKLADIRRRVLGTAARRELLIRDLEGDGFMPRPVHPELAIFKQAAVERLAG